MKTGFFQPSRQYGRKRKDRREFCQYRMNKGLFEKIRTELLKARLGFDKAVIKSYNQGTTSKKGMEACRNMGVSSILS